MKNVKSTFFGQALIRALFWQLLFLLLPDGQVIQTIFRMGLIHPL